MGNTMYNIMLKLAKDTGDPEAGALFKKAMEEALTTPAATPSHHLSASSWSCSAPSRRTAEANRRWPK